MKLIFINFLNALKGRNKLRPLRMRRSKRKQGAASKRPYKVL